MACLVSFCNISLLKVLINSLTILDISKTTGTIINSDSRLDKHDSLRGKFTN